MTPENMDLRGACGAVLAGVLVGGRVAMAGAAQAAAVAGPGGTAQQGRRLVQAEPAVGAAAATLDLIVARIEAIDAKTNTVTVGGKPVPLHPTQLRVVGPGGSALAGVSALRPGMRVRFALEPEARGAGLPAVIVTPASPHASPAEASRPIVLVYIDAQP